jgi:hypothetical protein
MELLRAIGQPGESAPLRALWPSLTVALEADARILRMRLYLLRRAGRFGRDIGIATSRRVLSREKGISAR